MKEKLQKLGIKTAFTDKCNATKMTEVPLFLKKVLHKSTITINEMGTEASSASSAFMDARSFRKPTHTFLADRPFLYFITTINEPISEVAKAAKVKDENYYHDSDFEDEILISGSECSTEPFNLLFVGTFC